MIAGAVYDYYIIFLSTSLVSSFDIWISLSSDGSDFAHMHVYVDMHTCTVQKKHAYRTRDWQAT